MIDRVHLKKLLISYSERFPDEQPVVDQFIAFVETEERCFDRSTRGHITASAWILDPSGEQALLTHHKKFNRWMQLGGHADGNPDTAAVALIEGYEESGLKKIEYLSPEIFDIDIHHIANACYAHYDLRYIFKAADCTYHVSEESFDLAWVPLTEIKEYNSSNSMNRLVAKTVMR